ncbi:m48 family protein [Vairimorpha apis BRL 01]|uniref:M48 family protein n=1 Tax=Vairimorpha apis BRL 01 TaxID=1037528 RepID=T0KXZ6_9MICR|nr:m48 family protein [Vairimorpha apis BRL 01]
MIFPFFDIIALVIVPFLMYKVLDYFYIKFKYYKIFIYAALVGIVKTIISLLLFNNVKVKKLKKNVLPQEIIEYFKIRNYKLNVLHLDLPKLNVGVASIFDIVTIVIFGNTLEIMSTNELTSILYHEIGHIENKSILFRMLVNKSISVILYIIEFMLIYYNRKLISPVEKQSHNYIKMYVLMNITLCPLLTSLNMYFSCLDELESDKFSVHKIDRRYLISALIKLTLENERFYGNSWLYDLMYFDHPSLDRRINYIKNIK